jgi:cation transport ATPase
MKHEEKVALATGTAVMLIAGPIALALGTPVAFGALAFGTYRTAKSAYDRALFRSKVRPPHGEL